MLGGVVAGGEKPPATRLHDFFYLAFASKAKLDQLSIYLFSITALITVVYSAFWTVVN
jgi:hypothetical protein